MTDWKRQHLCVTITQSMILDIHVHRGLSNIDVSIIELCTLYTAYRVYHDCVEFFEYMVHYPDIMQSLSQSYDNAKSWLRAFYEDTHDFESVLAPT